MTSTSTRKAAVLLLAAALALTACKRKAEKEPEIVRSEIAAGAGEAAAPFAYAVKSEAAEVDLALPPELKAQPDLHAQLYSQGVQELKAFEEGATAERAELGEGVDGAPAGPPYAREIDWTTTADTSKLMSLRKDVYEYAGGAHPNASHGAVIWDKALKKAVVPTALFRPKADLSRLDAAICAELKTAKQAKGADVSLLDQSTWRCPKARDSVFVLAPSTTPGKAGGLTFLYAPYSVGPYAEGAYAVTVPVSVFQSALAPAYADEFAGAPAANRQVAEAR